MYLLWNCCKDATVNCGWYAAADDDDAEIDVDDVDADADAVVIIVQRLPTTIGSLKKLQVLDLEENKLEFLPPEIGTLHTAEPWHSVFQFHSLEGSTLQVMDEFY